MIISTVDALQDDPAVIRDCDQFSNYPELKTLADEYNELLDVRFMSLKLKDMVPIFGAKLDRKPDDRVKPLFVPGTLVESGLSVPSDHDNPRNIDYHAIGDLGYLEVHHGFDGESVNAVVVFLRADDTFVPLQSTNDIPRREAWDKAKYEKLKLWLGVHLPKLTDLGVVEVSLSEPSRVDLGAGTVGVITARDIHVAKVPFWLAIDLVKETTDPKERGMSLQLNSVNRTNEAVGFAMDGKFYRMTPKLVDHLHNAK